MVRSISISSFMKEEKMDQVRAAMFIQNQIRSYNVTCVPEPKGSVPALRLTPDNKNKIGEAIAYRIDSNWVKPPPEIIGRSTEEAELDKGGFKSLTHRNKKYVGLTIFNLPGYETFSGDNIECQQIVQQFNLKRIVPQCRVNETLMISKNLGEALDYSAYYRSYLYNCADFVELAQEIDRLHDNQIILRDIKAANMFFHDGCVHISDLDSMGKVGSFDFWLATPSCLPEIFGIQDYTMDNAGKDASINGYKKDQHTFFASLIEIQLWTVDRRRAEECQDDVGKYSPYTEIDYQRFTKSLPCGLALQLELFDFLMDPEHHSLKHPLADYI